MTLQIACHMRSENSLKHSKVMLLQIKGNEVALEGWLMKAGISSFCARGNTGTFPTYQKNEEDIIPFPLCYQEVHLQVTLQGCMMLIMNKISHTQPFCDFVVLELDTFQTFKQGFAPSNLVRCEKLLAEKHFVFQGSPLLRMMHIYIEPLRMDDTG